MNQDFMSFLRKFTAKVIDMLNYKGKKTKKTYTRHGQGPTRNGLKRQELRKR